MWASESNQSGGVDHVHSRIVGDGNQFIVFIWINRGMGSVVIFEGKRKRANRLNCLPLSNLDLLVRCENTTHFNNMNKRYEMILIFKKISSGK